MKLLAAKNLKIGAHDYAVIKSLDHFEGDTCGIQSRKQKRLVFNSELPQTHQVATILHEIFHAINSELDHTLLDSLSEQFTQMLLDNVLLK